jgi:hypothetical protein
MTEVTRILSAIEQGDPHAAERLLPLVYTELRRLGAEKMAPDARAWLYRRLAGADTPSAR